MPDDKKDIIEHLKRIEYLLAGILLGRKPNVKQVAKAIKVSDNILTSIFPDKKGRNKKQVVSTEVNNETEISENNLENSAEEKEEKENE